jgi:hypothetical protein
MLRYTTVLTSDLYKKLRDSGLYAFVLPFAKFDVLTVVTLKVTGQTHCPYLQDREVQWTSVSISSMIMWSVCAVNAALFRMHVPTGSSNRQFAKRPATLQCSVNRLHCCGYVH